MVDILIESGMEILSTVLILLIDIFGAWVASKMVKRKELENIQIATAEVLRATQQTVLELEKTMVQGFREANADGKLTDNEIQALRAEVVNKTMDKMSAPALKVLQAAKVDLVKYIRSTAESILAQM